MFGDVDSVYLQSDVELNINIIKTIFLIFFIFYSNFKIIGKKIEINSELIKKSIIILIFGIPYSIIKNY